VSYLLNVASPSDMANFLRQQNVPAVPDLGYLSGRPNQAIEHGIYNVLPLRPVTHLSSIFDDATLNMKFLIGGVAIVAAGLILLGRKRSGRRRRMRHYRRRILS